MLQIAGGILIAVAVLAFLPQILEAGLWALIIGAGVAIAACAWFSLAAAVGNGWAVAIMVGAVLTAVVWAELPDEQRTPSELLKTALTMPLALVALGLILGSMLAGLTLAAGILGLLIILGIWIFGDVGGFLGSAAFIALCFWLHHWWKRRGDEISLNARQALKRRWAAIQGRMFGQKARSAARQRKIGAHPERPTELS